MHPRVLLFAGALAVTAMPAHASANPSPSPHVECNDAGSQFAVGRPYSKRLEKRARRAAGAQSVRILRPGEMYTMDYVDTRLNLYLDDHAVVTSATCG